MRSAALVTAFSVIVTGLATGAAVAPAVAAPIVAPAAATADQSTGCSFADSGSGTYANTLCWLDLSSIDSRAATSQGQQLSVTLPGGYTITATVKTSGGAGAPHVLPTWSGAYLGKQAYTGVTGKPAYYQTQSGSTTTVALSGIQVTDKNGIVVTGYAFVGADAESTDAGESIAWTSDKSLRSIGTLGNACGGTLTGVGTTSVRCSATSTGTKTGTAILAATNPSTLSQTMVGSGLQAVAFGVLVSSVRVDKQLTARAEPGDSFAVDVASGSSVLGTADTGSTGNTASTGDVFVLADDAGTSYTVSESATSGSLSDYTDDWACTRSGAGTGTLPSGSGASKTVTVGVGDSVQCTVTNTPLPRALSVTKTSTATATSRPGDTVDYQVTATNTGQLAYSDAVPARVVDDLSGVLDDAAFHNDATATGADGDLTYSAPRLTWSGPLGVGDSVTVDYSVVLGSAGDGVLRNVAFAPDPTNPNQPTPACDGTGTTDPTTGVPCATITTDVPRLQITKTADKSELPKVGDTVTYTVTAKNTGAGAYTTGAPATVVDDLTKVLDDATLDTSSLQSDAGATPTYSSPRITWSGALDPGKSVIVTYTVTYTGGGDHRLVNVAFGSDGTTGDPTPACDDASGWDSTTGQPCASVQVPGAALVVTKSASPASGTAVVPGQKLDYTLSFQNTGTVAASVDRFDDLSAVLDDADLTAQPTASDSSLTVGAVTAGTFEVTGSITPGATVTVRYSVTVKPLADQGDHRLGNFLLVNGQQAPADGECAANSTDCTGNPVSGLSLVKSGSLAAGAGSRAGDLVDYSFTIKNTGAAPLTGVDVTDAMPGLSTITYGVWPGAPGALAPGESVTATATHALTQADVDAGTVGNTATAHGTPSAGDPVADSSTANVVVPQTPAITLAKSGHLASGAAGAAGDSVHYDFVATNTGNVTLHGVAVTDPKSGLSALSYSWPGQPGTLAPGQAMTATATYVLTQADVNTGAVQNTATAHGTPPAGSAVTADDTATVTVPSAPAITLTKSGSLDAGSTGAAGDTARYAFSVTNTGNVTLHDVTVTDPHPGLSAIDYGTWPGNPGELAPGQSVTATASYLLTQADVDAGAVHNTATAQGTPPTGAPVTGDGSASIAVAPAPAIALQKTAAYAAGATGKVGEHVDYSFTVSNTGNVTLHAVAVDDPHTGLSAIDYGTWPGKAGELAPGQTVTATATYVLTQADVDAGSVQNTATVSGTPPTGDPVDGSSTAKISTPQGPALQLVKTGTVAASGTPHAGDTVDYTFTVSNIGNLTVHGVSVADRMSGLSGIEYGTWPADSGVLAPGQFVTATAHYVLTQADIDAGSIDNTATAGGSAPNGDPVTDDDTATVVIPAAASVTLKKTGELAREAKGKAGDTVTYTFVVGNTGNVTLNAVSIADALPGLSAIHYASWPAQAGALAPGESVTATATYSLTAADVVAGDVDNTATATATPPHGDPVTGTSTVRVSLPQQAAPGLAHTGSDVLLGGIGALALLLIGLALLLVRRRRAAGDA
jgi:uncharacterized repeat protein (TIGR01451 family)